MPTEIPTPNPTQNPTEIPTTLPPTTDEPSFTPSRTPTEVPTPAPTFVPSEVPTPSPTHGPTPSPTRPPTVIPTAAPTATPTSAPTISPTRAPTAGGATYRYYKFEVEDINMSNGWAVDQVLLIANGRTLAPSGAGAITPGSCSWGAQPANVFARPSNVYGNRVVPCSLTVDMGTPTTINEYGFILPGPHGEHYRPHAWKFYGSNANSASSWVELDEQSFGTKCGGYHSRSRCASSWLAFGGTTQAGTSGRWTHSLSPISG